jgi:hypothetical protein
MELESEYNVPIITITKQRPQQIFINDFNTFCNTIKEVTNCEDFFCKSSTNGVCLSTHLSDSYRSDIKYFKLQ